jgi:hypothetical protein
MNECKRRRLLRAGAVAVGAGLAGCLGGGDGDDDNGDNETQNSDDGGNNGESDGNGETRQEFDAAVETLQIVEAGLSNYRTGEDNPTEASEGGVQSQEIDALRSRLDEAESTLEGIDASGELATQVSIALDVGAFQRTLIDALEHWRERNEAFEAAAVAQGNEEYETAATEYGAAADALEQYRTLLDEIESAHAAIDSETFEAEAISYGAEVWAYLRVNSRGEIDARQTFLSGEQSRITGVGALSAAQEAWDNERWETARTGYETASGAFTEAKSAYEDVLNNPDTPALLEESVNGQPGEMGQLSDAMSLLVDAAEAAAAGNQEEAENLRDQAVEQFP